MGGTQGLDDVRLASLVRPLVDDNAKFGAFVWLVPVVDLSVDLVPLVLFSNTSAVVEQQCPACKVPQPQDVRMPLVPVLVPLTLDVLVQADPGLIPLPFGGNGLYGTLKGLAVL